MIEIATNNFYHLRLDTVNNRLYIKAIGFWDDEVADNYLKQTKEALMYLNKNFTILSDVTELTTQKQSVQQKIEEWQKMVKAAGLLKGASIVPKDFVTKFQLDAMAKRTAIPKGVFTTHEEADKWLDEQSKQL